MAETTNIEELSKLKESKNPLAQIKDILDQSAQTENEERLARNYTRHAELQIPLLKAMAPKSLPIELLPGEKIINKETGRLYAEPSLPLTERVLTKLGILADGMTLEEFLQNPPSNSDRDSTLIAPVEKESDILSPTNIKGVDLRINKETKKVTIFLSPEAIDQLQPRSKAA